jgi:hypothetical protein
LNIQRSPGDVETQVIYRDTDCGTNGQKSPVRQPMSLHQRVD